MKDSQFYAIMMMLCFIVSKLCANPLMGLVMAMVGLVYLVYSCIALFRQP